MSRSRERPLHDLQRSRTAPTTTVTDVDDRIRVCLRVRPPIGRRLHRSTTTSPCGREDVALRHAGTATERRSATCTSAAPGRRCARRSRAARVRPNRQRQDAHRFWRAAAVGSEAAAGGIGRRRGGGGGARRRRVARAARALRGGGAARGGGRAAVDCLELLRDLQREPLRISRRRRRTPTRRRRCRCTRTRTARSSSAASSSSPSPRSRRRCARCVARSASDPCGRPTPTSARHDRTPCSSSTSSIGCATTATPTTTPSPSAAAAAAG